MDSTGLVKFWRDSVRDTKAPYFWSETEAYTYAQAAYVMFTRLTGGVPDFTSEACEVDVVAGEPIAELHPAILTIHAAELKSTGAPVKIVNHTDTRALQMLSYGKSVNLAADKSVGKVTHMVIGMQRNRAQLIRIPEADDTITLIIDRMPLNRIDTQGAEIVDVDEMHHIHLVQWMSHLAYMKKDADSFDPRGSEDAERKFREYCAQVKSEIGRYKHKPRAVAYGGI